MRKISLILFCLICYFGAQAQVPQPPYSPNSPTAKYKVGYLIADSALIATPRDTSWNPALKGSMVYWQQAGVDSSFWVFNGKTTGQKWQKIVTLPGGGSGGLVIQVVGTYPVLVGGTPTIPVISVDTGLHLSQLVTGGRLYKISDSLAAIINLKLNISDTATMLANYVTYAGYGLSKSGKSFYVDTSLIVPYTDTLKSNGVATKTYVQSQISASGNGTVFSIATNNASGITGGTITTNGTLAADTTILSTRLYVQSQLTNTGAATIWTRTGGTISPINGQDTVTAKRIVGTSDILAPNLFSSISLTTNGTFVANGAAYMPALPAANPGYAVTINRLVDGQLGYATMPTSGLGSLSNVSPVGTQGLTASVTGNGTATAVITYGMSGATITPGAISTGQGNFSNLSATGVIYAPVLSGTILILTEQTAPSYAKGQLYFDITCQCLTFRNNDANVSMNIGQEVWIMVRNLTGSIIPNGSAVYGNGASGGIPTVALAQANASSTTIVIGLATEDIANGAIGYVTAIGAVNGISTIAFPQGSTVFLSATSAGALTNTAPLAPNFRYRVGIVGTSSATVGTIHVTPSTAALGNGTADQLLGMGATSQEWKTVAAGVGIGVSNTAGVITIYSTAGVGVSSLTGTANQIVASATTGAISLSLSPALVLPGTLSTAFPITSTSSITASNVLATNLSVTGQTTVRVLSVVSNATIGGTLVVTGTITGTLATAAQPNITSVGTLTAVTTTGTITAVGLSVVNATFTNMTVTTNAGMSVVSISNTLTTRSLTVTTAIAANTLSVTGGANVGGIITTPELRVSPVVGGGIIRVYRSGAQIGVNASDDAGGGTQTASDWSDFATTNRNFYTNSVYRGGWQTSGLFTTNVNAQVNNQIGLGQLSAFDASQYAVWVRNGGGIFSDGTGGLNILSGMFYNAGYKYALNSYGGVALTGLAGGDLVVSTAPPGSGGAAATITERFRVAQGGVVTVQNLGTGAVQATAGVLSIVSDSRVKDKKGYFTGSAMGALMKIPKPQYWNYNKKSKLPIAAQKVKQFSVFADSVHYVLGEQFAPTQKDGYYSLADRALLSLTIQALQEENKKVESLEARLAALEKIVNSLTKK